jgi:hypothetical protein
MNLMGQGKGGYELGGMSAVKACEVFAMTLLLVAFFE